MLHCHPDIETGVRVIVPGSSVLGFDGVCVNVPELTVLGFDVGHYHASLGCKWAFHVIVLPVDMGIR